MKAILMQDSTILPLGGGGKPVQASKIHMGQVEVTTRNTPTNAIPNGTIPVPDAEGRSACLLLGQEIKRGEVEDNFHTLRGGQGSA